MLSEKTRTLDAFGTAQRNNKWPSHVRECREFKAASSAMVGPQTTRKTAKEADKKQGVSEFFFCRVCPRPPQNDPLHFVSSRKITRGPRGFRSIPSAGKMHSPSLSRGFRNGERDVVSNSQLKVDISRRDPIASRRGAQLSPASFPSLTRSILLSRLDCPSPTPLARRI